MPPPVKRSTTLLFGLFAIISLIGPPSAHAPGLPIEALAPFEIFVDGLKSPQYLAIDPQDRLFLSEAEPGQILQIAPDRTVTLLIDKLEGPEGLVLDGTGALFLAAERQQGAEGKGQKGVIFRRDPKSRALSIVATEFEQPKGLALHPAGHLALTAEGQKGERDEKGGLYMINASGGITMLIYGFKEPHGVLVAPDGSLLVAAERFERGRTLINGSLFSVDAAGQVTAVIPRPLKNAFGVARDPLDGLYLAGGTHTGGPGPDLGVILKRRPDGRDVVFAHGLHHPKGLALDSNGNLYAVEAEGKRLLKFTAPTAPRLDPAPPALTNQAALTLQGMAESSALITAHGGSAPVIGFADPAGHFSLTLPLNHNASNTRQVFATGAAGDGLTSASTEVTIVQDAIPPSVRLVSPTDGATLTGAFAVEVEATDALAGVEGVNLLMDGHLIAATNVPPYRSSLDAKDYTGGQHTLTVQVTDRAGNQASTSITIIVATLRIAITTPTEGATLSGTSVRVRGTVTGPVAEIGVSVNGFAAQVNMGQWAAEVPVVAGTNVLSVTATDTTAAQSNLSVTVTVSQATVAPVLLRAVPESGVAPLVVTWQVINQTGRPLVRFELDETGTGTFGPPMANFAGVRTTYTGPGLRLPTLRVNNDQGTVYIATTAVNIEDPEIVTTRFQARWNSFKARLQAGDISGALGHLAPSLQSRFQTLFGQLGADLPAIAAGLGDLEVLEQVGDLAETVIVQNENGAPFLHFIHFRRDSLGRWLIEEM